MNHAKNNDLVFVHFIYEQVPGTRDALFARAGDPAWATRIHSGQALSGTINTADEQNSNAWIVGEMFKNVIEIGAGSACPN